MTTEPVALPAAPARELVPLAIAALLAAVAALVCYGVLFSTLDRQPGQRLPIEVLYLPLAVLAGAAWIKTSLKVSAVLGALAGALYGLTLGFLILGQTGGSAGTIVFVLGACAALGAMAGSVAFLFATLVLAAFTRPLQGRVSSGALRLWKGATFLWLSGIPPVLWCISAEPFVHSSGLLLLPALALVAWVLWRGVQGNRSWLVAAPLVALAVLLGWYWLVEFSYVGVRWQTFSGWDVPSYVEGRETTPEEYLAEHIDERYGAFVAADLLLIVGLHSAPLAALVWGGIAWQLWRKTRAGAVT